MQWIFIAEIGINEKDQPVLFLNGRYQNRAWFKILHGTLTTTDNKQGNFRGIFHDNYFVLKATIGRGRSFIMIGSCTFNQEQSSFRGLWKIRATRINGWITGIFQPT
jgi:hypothetical protein